ncbi:MAG: T9SS type A sorting domain-containing protein, partial [Candidatus Krumholzibacteriota bacterium]|nr:T9SS type A sorting domain-containing protein [Candidatus Krumholzibacteriota bacterium]
AGNTNADGIKVTGGTAYAANVWRNVGKPFIVTGSPTIHSDGSLNIRSSVEVRFENGVTLSVNGSLSTSGVINHPVLMTRRNTDDEWSGLSLNAGSSASLRYCTIEYVTRYDGKAVSINSCAPYLEHCVLRQNDTAVLATNASPRFVNCTITGNNAYGVFLSGACTPDFGTTLGEWNDIHDNGSGTPDRDLVNGTEDIYARYVYWGTVVESEIEDMIHHEFDDAALGLVIYSPWTDAGHEELHYWIFTGIDDESVDPLPRVFALAQNHPNPFNPATTIEYALPEDARVRLDVYDVAGRKVARLLDEWQTAGFKSLTWKAGDRASGIYFYRIEAGDFAETRRMVLVK